MPVRVIRLPTRADALITRMERGELNVRDPQLSENVKKLEKTVSKAVGGIIFAAFLLASIQLSSGQQEVLTWVFRIAALVSLLWMIFSNWC